MSQNNKHEFIWMLNMLYIKKKWNLYAVELILLTMVN